MPPRSPNAGQRTQGSRSVGKPRPTSVLLALQQHEYLSEQPHHELGAHILQSLMEIQPNCPPNFELDFRRLVPLGPEGDITQAWLNDTLLSVGVKHIRAGMPDPSAEPQAGVVPACPRNALLLQCVVFLCRPPSSWIPKKTTSCAGPVAATGCF
jgi:hypothetical protein